LFLTNATRCWKHSVSLHSFKSRTPFPFTGTILGSISCKGGAFRSLHWSTRIFEEFYAALSVVRRRRWSSTRLVNVLRMVARLDQFDDRQGNRRQGCRKNHSQSDARTRRRVYLPSIAPKLPHASTYKTNSYSQTCDETSRKSSELHPTTSRS